jgi:hypothetical protein
LRVVSLEGLGVVLLLIAKPGAKWDDPWTVLDQSVPIIMPDFVTEMAQEGAIGLVQLEPPLFALRVVRLRHIDGDDPIGIPGEYWSGFRRRGIGKKLISQAMLRADGLRRDRASQPQETIEEAPLRSLEFIPGVLVPRDAQVWDVSSQTAGLAERPGVMVRDGPVADIRPGVVVTETIAPSVGLWAWGLPQVRPHWVKRPDDAQIREIGQCVLTPLTLRILEKNYMLTVVTMENVHEP